MFVATRTIDSCSSFFHFHDDDGEEEEEQQQEATRSGKLAKGQEKFENRTAEKERGRERPILPRSYNTKHQ